MLRGGQLIKSNCGFLFLFSSLQIFSSLQSHFYLNGGEKVASIVFTSFS